MNRLFTLLIFCGTLTVGVAQQAPQYSMYLFNKFGFNPAYAGLDHTLSITGVSRWQWVNLQGSPQTQQVNVHMPLYLVGGGLGMTFENDQLGAEQRLAFSLAYNYQIPVGAKGILSFGLSAGYLQYSLDGAKILTPGGDYEGGQIDHNDQLLPVGKESTSAPTAHAGIYYQGEWLEAGFSAVNLLETPLGFGGFDYQLARSYYFNLGGKLALGRRFQLLPGVLVKSDLEQLEIDLSAVVQYNDNIFGGASFRGYNAESLDGVVILAGIKLNEKITLAYSYDLTLSTLREVSDGSHEILINYNLGKPVGKGKMPPVIYNPRFR